MVVPNGKELISEKASVLVRARGKFPVAKIVDVRNDKLSVGSLWENFSINNVNTKLISKLKGNEENYKDFNDTRGSMDQMNDINSNRLLWNFGHLINKKDSDKEKIKPREINLTL